MIQFNSIELGNRTIKITFPTDEDARAFYELALQARGNGELVTNGDGVLRTLRTKNEKSVEKKKVERRTKRRR